jgi:hypothetical protein
MVVLACMEPQLSPEEEQRLRAYNIGSAALGDDAVVRVCVCVCFCDLVNPGMRSMRIQHRICCFGQRYSGTFVFACLMNKGTVFACIQHGLCCFG